jgi:chorismate synthase
MSANSWGNHFKISTFGESHGPALGVVIDGCPAGVLFNEALLLENLKRRRPGLTAGTSARAENDMPEILSGVYQGRTLGTPIAMMVRNLDARPQDYSEIQKQPRTGHADDVWKDKFFHTDHRGGGRSSGRETVARVLAGSVAQMMVKQLFPECAITAFSKKIGPYELSSWPNFSGQLLPAHHYPLGFPAENATEVRDFLIKAQKDGESYGGIAGLDIGHPPPSLGQPVFHKLKSDLSAAMMSVGATTAVELGAGVTSSELKGSEFHSSPTSAHYSGIRGGLSTGEPVRMQIHFKPTSSIMDVAKKGRHDPCIVPRALPVLESMAWLTLADHVLWQRIDKI